MCRLFSPKMENSVWYGDNFKGSVKFIGSVLFGILIIVQSLISFCEPLFFIFLDWVINQNDTAIGQTNKCCLVKKLSVATCSNRREGQHHENRDKSVFVETHSDNITLVLFFKKEVRQKRQRLVGAGGTNWSAGGHLKSWAKKWTTHITRGPGKCSSRGPAALSHYSALPQRSNGGWDGAEPHTGHRGCN